MKKHITNFLKSYIVMILVMSPFIYTQMEADKKRDHKKSRLCDKAFMAIQFITTMNLVRITNNYKKAK